MPLTFGDTHPSALSAVDTADLLLHEANMRDLDLDKRAVEAEIRKLHAHLRSLEAEHRHADHLETENRRLQADNTSLQADIRRLLDKVRALQTASRRANDDWETKHIFGFALSQPLRVPELP